MRAVWSSLLIGCSAEPIVFDLDGVLGQRVVFLAEALDREEGGRISRASTAVLVEGGAIISGDPPILDGVGPDALVLRVAFDPRAAFRSDELTIPGELDDFTTVEVGVVSKTPMVPNEDRLLGQLEVGQIEVEAVPPDPTFSAGAALVARDVAVDQARTCRDEVITLERYDDVRFGDAGRLKIERIRRLDSARTVVLTRGFVGIVSRSGEQEFVTPAELYPAASIGQFRGVALGPVRGSRRSLVLAAVCGGTCDAREGRVFELAVDGRGFVRTSTGGAIFRTAATVPNLRLWDVAIDAEDRVAVLGADGAVLEFTVGSTVVSRTGLALPCEAPCGDDGRITSAGSGRWLFAQEEQIGRFDGARWQFEEHGASGNFMSVSSDGTFDYAGSIRGNIFWRFEEWDLMTLALPEGYFSANPCGAAGSDSIWRLLRDVIDLANAGGALYAVFEDCAAVIRFRLDGGRPGCMTTLLTPDRVDVESIDVSEGEIVAGSEEGGHIFGAMVE